MTLDEAIRHCEEVAKDKADLACTLWDSKEKARCGGCANEHKQLAKWLRELKAYKEQDGDTIDRQAAIRIASGYCHPANIADELAKLPPVQTEQQWIPVSERLPEDSEDVLVWFEYFRYGDYNRMYSTYGIGNYESLFDSWFVNHESGWTSLHVFAWMPMPEPYKAKSEDEE